MEDPKQKEKIWNFKVPFAVDAEVRRWQHLSQINSRKATLLRLIEIAIKAKPKGDVK